MPTRGYTHPGSRRTSVYDPTLTTTYLTGLWRDCPLAEYAHDPSIGFLLDERFVSYDAAATTGDWILTQATQGTGAMSTADPCTLLLDSNSSTDTQGANLQRAKSAFLPAAGKDIWMEWRCKIADTPDFCQFFGGLSELDTTLIASSLNSSANHIGFETVSEDNIAIFASEKASTRETIAAAHTFVDDTFVKFGFKVTGVTSVEAYVNGVSIGSLTTAAVPIVAVYPSFVCQSAGTNDPILHINSLRIFQLR